MRLARGRYLADEFSPLTRGWFGMVTSVIDSELAQRIAELRFCVAELRRRQQTDRWRAWLWLLKENAARQTLAMLTQSASEFETDELAPVVLSLVELSPAARAGVLAHHSLLQDPRVGCQSQWPPRWRVELQTHVRQVLESHLDETH